MTDPRELSDLEMLRHIVFGAGITRARIAEILAVLAAVVAVGLGGWFIVLMAWAASL